MIWRDKYKDGKVWHGPGLVHLLVYGPLKILYHIGDVEYSSKCDYVTYGLDPKRIISHRIKSILEWF